MSSTEEQLTNLLQSLDSQSGVRIAASDVDLQLTPLLHAFLPTATPHARSLAFLALSRLVANARPKDPSTASAKSQEDATAQLTSFLSTPLSTRIGSTDVRDVLPASGLLTALFQVDQATASKILLADGVMESVMDATDLFGAGEDAREVRRNVASLLSQASGSKTCRPIVEAHALSWLKEQSDQTSDPMLRAAAAISLVKLTRGTNEDATAGVTLAEPAAASEASAAQPSNDHLLSLMKGLIVSSSPSSTEPAPDATLQATRDAVEGLAYLSSDPSIREALSSDTAYLKRLFALVPPPRKRQTGPVPVISEDAINSPRGRQGTSGSLYGVALIVSNIVAFRPHLTEEERQVEKLKKMTQAGAQKGQKLAETKDPADALMDDAVVKRRCKRLLKAGVLPALVALSSISESSEIVRRTTGKAFLSFVEDKDDRGKVIQAGGAKALLTIIRASLVAIDAQPAAPQAPKSKFDTASTAPIRALDAPDLHAIQALAKLSITASPLLLFGPDASSSIDAIRPLGHLLLNPSSNLLQKFEALMALTNLGSLGAAVASRIAAHKEQGLGSVLSKTETLLLDDNALVRRAAMELTCNLVSSDEVWERYTGEGADGTATTAATDHGGVTSKALVNRLRIVLALSDVDDAKTRLAASGALAMLSSSENVCGVMMGEMEDGPRKTFTILVDLLGPSSNTTEHPTTHEADQGEDAHDHDGPPAPPPPDIQPQLVHRGIICLRNILTNFASASGDAGVTSAVVKAAEDVGVAVAVVEVLKSPTAAGNRDIVMAAAETLKWLKDHGVKLPSL